MKNMSKKKLAIIITAAVLAAAILAGSLLWIFLRPVKAEDLNTVDVLRLMMPGETIVEEDFSGVDGGEVPEGWTKTVAYSFLESSGSSTSLETTGGNRNHVAVSHPTDLDYLGFCGRGGEHILTLPDVGAKDLVFTSAFSFASFKNPFGIALDISADSALIFSIQASDVTPDDGIDNTVPVYSIYRRTAGGDTFSETERVDITASEVTPGLVTVSDKATGSAVFASDTVVTLSVYRYSGIYYFYADSTLIYALKRPEDTSGSAIGYFSNTEGREVKLYSTSVHRLKYAPDTAKEMFVSGRAVYEDFSAVAEGKLPDKWKLYSGRWLPDGDLGQAGAASSALSVVSTGGSAAVMFPAVSSRNVLINAEITLDSLDGSVGIVSGVGGDQLVNSTGGSLAAISPAEGTVWQCGISADGKSGLKTYGTADIFSDDFAAGDSVKLMVYCADGTAYFFINDTFVSYNKMSGSGAKKQHYGIYTSENSGITVKNVSVDLLVTRGKTDSITLSEDAAVALGESTVALSVSGSINKKDTLYAAFGDENFSGQSGLTFGTASLYCDSRTVSQFTADTDRVTLTEAGLTGENASAASFSCTLPETEKADLNRFLAVRGYAAVEKDGVTEYFYGPITVYNPAALASNMYLDAEQGVKDTLDTIFEGCDKYIGKYERTLTFALFSDFHYKQGMYSTSVADMQAILDRANAAGASFILSAGDFCNDFSGSPELMKAFLENSYGMLAYNIYGNHELESSGNIMSVVTPLLTNDKNVVWGTADGKIGDGSVAYYYFENGGFRIICTDTNYSYNSTTGQWEHNTEGSYGPPSGNTSGNSLGPDQLAWLEDVLFDAARNGTPCIVVSHDSFSGTFRSVSPDAAAVRELYNRVNAYRKGTVLLSINGHIHTNNMQVVDGVLYIDMNTTRNCLWKGTGSEHYGKEQTFTYVEYDTAGNPIYEEERSLGDLSMGDNTWFSEDPLSAIVTISQYGTVTVEGTESTWAYGVVPAGALNDQEPRVSSGTWELIN